MRFAKQIRPVAQRAHIERIGTKLFFGQYFHGQMGQIFVLQLDRADVVFIRLLVVDNLRHTIRANNDHRFCTITYLHGHGLGQDVLLFKEHFKFALHLGQCKNAIMERGQNRDQHIGVMLDFVQIKMVFIVVVGSLVGVEIPLQLLFQLGVGFLCTQHILVLGKVRRCCHAGPSGARHHGAGLQTRYQQQGQQTEHRHNQNGFPVLGRKFDHPFAALGCQLCYPETVLCGGSGPLRGGLTSLPCSLGILLLDALFLPHPGNGIAGRLCNLRIVLQGFLVKVFCIGRHELTLCLFHGLVGLHLVMPDAAADDLGGLPLHQFFPLVAALHAHIFVFDFVDFSVGEQQCFRNWAAGRVWFQAGRAFVLLLKTQGGFRLAAGGIVDFSLDRNTLFRQSGAGRIQLVGFRFRLLDKRLQFRVRPFFFGQFQTGGGTVQAIFTFGSFRSLFGFFLCLVLILYILGTFQNFFGLALGIRGVVLFRFTGRNVLNSTSDLIFHHQTITGHGLGDFGFRLQFFQSSSPPIGQRPVSMSAMYLRIGNTCGGETALPSVFIRLLRFGTSSVRRGMSAGSLAQREYPSICAGNPSATPPSPG